MMMLVAKQPHSNLALSSPARVHVNADPLPELNRLCACLCGNAEETHDSEHNSEESLGPVQLLPSTQLQTCEQVLVVKLSGAAEVEQEVVPRA